VNVLERRKPAVTIIFGWTLGHENIMISKLCEEALSITGRWTRQSANELTADFPLALTPFHLRELSLWFGLTYRHTDKCRQGQTHTDRQTDRQSTAELETNSALALGMCGFQNTTSVQILVQFWKETRFSISLFLIAVFSLVFDF